MRVARLISVAASRSARDTLRTLRSGWALGSLRAGLIRAQGCLVVLAGRRIIYDAQAAVVVRVAAVDYAVAIWNRGLRNCKRRCTYACRNQDDPDMILDCPSTLMFPFMKERTARPTRALSGSWP